MSNISNNYVPIYGSGGSEPDGCLDLANVPAYCRRVLGCHPHLSCVGKALGFGVALFEACGCRQGLCPKQAVWCGPSM